MHKKQLHFLLFFEKCNCFNGISMNFCLTLQFPVSYRLRHSMNTGICFSQEASE